MEAEQYMEYIQSCLDEREERRRHRLSGWKDIQNPWDLTGQTSVADIPGIQEFDWYRASDIILNNEKLDDWEKQALNHSTIQAGLRQLRLYYSFSIPSEEALEVIGEFGPICEVGAGAGYWASLLEERGTDIIAYDIQPYSDDLDSRVLNALRESIECNSKEDREYLWEYLEDHNRPWQCYRSFFPVRECEPDFTPPADRTLFISWPVYDDPMANDTLNRYDGDTFIYIGEPPGYACANDDFFENLEESWEEHRSVDILKLYGMYDYMEVYKRR